MDDKTFIAAFAAKEATRINERLKKMIASPDAPSEEEKASITADIQLTLDRMKKALAQITPEMLEEDSEDHGHSA